jgi:hypothetical protein
MYMPLLTVLEARRISRETLLQKNFNYNLVWSSRAKRFLNVCPVFALGLDTICGTPMRDGICRDSKGFLNSDYEKTYSKLIANE